MLNRKDFILTMFCAGLLGLAALSLAPMITKNVLFLAALPLAGMLFLVMVLNVHHMFVFIIMTRCFMDPILEKTRLGGGGGLGGVLNLFVVIMVFLLIIKNPKVLAGNRYAFAWVLFLAIAGFTVLYSPLRSQAIRLLMSQMTYAALFVVPFFIVKTEKDKVFWIKLLFLSSFIPVALANVGVVIKHPQLYAWNRLAGTFTHSNILAFYLVLVIALTFYILKTRILRLSVMQRFFLWLYIGDLLMVLVITETRSAWMSCVALFLIYSLLKERKMLFIFLIAGALMISLPVVQTRLKDLSEGTGARSTEKLNSWTWRLRLWESAMPSIQKRLFVGHGLGSFQYLSKDFFALEKGTGAPAHNVYVELLFETGLLGLLAYLNIYWTILKTFFRRIRATTGAASVEATILFAYIIGYMMVCVSDNALYYLAFNWYFWFFSGVVIAGVSLQNKTPEIPKAA